MEKEILRALEKSAELGWITFAKDINHEVVASMIVEIAFKDMTLRKALEIFVPKDLY